MNKGFTLVELAIVITIIGLLIGGVLKGQELLQNARMTSAFTQYKAYATGVITFKDIYKALPGDIRTPANFIQGCTAAPCNITGDGNGIIGTNGGWGVSDENQNFWLHLSKANLISGIDPNATWTTATWFGATAPAPNFPLGGRMQVIYLSPTTWHAVANPEGHYWHGFTTGGGQAPVVCSLVGKYDLKVDDGKPLTGTVLMHPSYPLTSPGASTYDPNNNDSCNLVIRADF